MGYSCAAKAGIVARKLIEKLQLDSGETKTSNTWSVKGTKYFDERGRENADGAVTGTVYRFINETQCLPAGGYRIEPDGKIARFPTSTKDQRELAELEGEKQFNETYHRVGTNV